MSSFFGKPATKTTTVKPDPRVAAMLKDILNDSNKIDDFDFISHEAATYSPEAKQAINNLASSGNLRAISGALAPRLQQGIEQASKLNQDYESTLNNPINVNQVLQQSDALRNGLYKTVESTAANAGGVANRLGSAASRAAARRGASQMQAANKMNNQFTNLAINQADQNRKNALDVAGMQGNISQANSNLGLKGIDLGAQATANQLTAGNILQGYQNALFQNQQANEQGNNNFIWQKLAQKQNIGGQVSNMAGYKIVEKGDSVSQGRQLLGAGIAGLGAMAQNSMNQSAYMPMSGSGYDMGTSEGLNNTKQAYSALDLGGVDTPYNYKANMTAVNDAARNINQNGNNGFWGNALNGVTGALSNMVGG